MSQIVVCALYKFVRLDDYQALRAPLLDTLQNNQVRGTLLLASEGIIQRLKGWCGAAQHHGDVQFRCSLDGNITS